MKYLKAKAVKEAVKVNGKQIAKDALLAIDNRIAEFIAQLCDETLVGKVKRVSVNEVKQILG